MFTYRRLATAVVSLGALAPTGFAQAPGGTVFDIQGALHGDWILFSDPGFIPGSQGGHFGLDTLAVQEIAPEFVPGTVPIPAEHWADLWIKVFRTPGTTAPGTMIAVDKDVFNETFTHWTDFHMEVGLDIGPNFHSIDGLEFKTDPPPIEETGAFANPPMSKTPHDLWWLVDDQHPGVPPIMGGFDRSLGASARFWLGINIPNALFQPDSATGGEVAMITLRQHWTPAPGAVGVFALAGVATLRRRRST